MKVLHLLYDHPANPWVGGGGAVRAREVNRRLANRDDVEIEMVCGAYPGASDVAVPGFVTRFVGPSRPYPVSRLGYAHAAARLLERSSFDVALIDFSVYTPLRLPRNPAGPIMAVVHHVTGLEARERWGRIGGRLLDRHETRRLRAFRWISADSAHTFHAVRERVGEDTEVRLIENGVDPALFDIRREPAEPPFLLYLGRLDVFHKGLDVLLEAFGRLAAERPAIELRVAGRGKDAAQLARRATASPAAGRIRLLGAVSELEKRALYARAAAVVMPSRMEGWGMVAAEALAAGTPLVASSAGSLPEVIGQAAAPLVRPGDPDSLLHALRAVLDDPAGRERAAAADRETARRRFSWDFIAEQHHRFLRNIVDSARAF